MAYKPFNTICVYIHNKTQRYINMPYYHDHDAANNVPYQNSIFVTLVGLIFFIESRFHKLPYYHAITNIHPTQKKY